MPKTSHDVLISNPDDLKEIWGKKHCDSGVDTAKFINETLIKKKKSSFANVNPTDINIFNSEKKTAKLAQLRRFIQIDGKNWNIQEEGEEDEEKAASGSGEDAEENGEDEEMSKKALLKGYANMHSEINDLRAKMLTEDRLNSFENRLMDLANSHYSLRSKFEAMREILEVSNEDIADFIAEDEADPSWLAVKEGKKKAVFPEPSFEEILAETLPNENGKTPAQLKGNSSEEEMAEVKLNKRTKKGIVDIPSAAEISEMEKGKAKKLSKQIVEITKKRGKQKPEGLPFPQPTVSLADAEDVENKIVEIVD